MAGDSGERKFVEQLPRRSDDYSRWYLDVIAKAELADYSPVRGCMVIRPYGYTIWENMQSLLDARFKATGHVNAYFPLFVPESLLTREADHVEGFAPEVAWVTHAGGEELEERLAIRPTSEAIIGTMYSEWVQSWRDLPVLINQWCNVVRWEKRTLPFLRTTEFLWQEGHTAHRTSDEAEEETQRMLEVYRDFLETELAIPVIPGRKTESEKFPGANATYTVEALMPDGRALQSGTSHFFGQNFANAFDISFQDLDGERRHAWTTSWGLSTRTVGALIMVHGDDSGLIIPPRVAPIHVVIVPIPAKTEEDEQAIRAAVERIEVALKPHFRVKTDWSEKTPGWKFNEWELRGVPIRLEVGPRDVKTGVATLVRRDNRAKQAVAEADIPSSVTHLLEEIQQSLFDRAKEARDNATKTVDSLVEFSEIMAGPRGFLRARWCENPVCEAAIKEQTGATIRCLPRDEPDDLGPCVCCGSPSERRALFARAY
ncbi:MAG: proline--tRNA ligase [Chloroflexota bacterium]